MKVKNFTLVLLLTSLFYFLFSYSAYSQLDLPAGSQMASISQKVGLSYITIKYSRPSVRDREIWGKLVPYGMNNLGFGTAKESPWRAGANENTIIKFSDDVSVNGEKIKAGKYGLHMVIHENDDVDIIFSSNSSAWGSFFYNPDEDVLTVTVKSEKSDHTELLTYLFTEVDKTSTTATLFWAEKKIPFKIDVNVSEIVLANIRKDLQGRKGFTDVSWNQAANYSLNNDGDLNEALKWSDNSIDGAFIGKKNFTNLQTKAKILTKMNKNDEAAKVMEEALPLGTVLQIHAYGRQLIAQGAKDEAMEVFKKNAKMNPNTWPVNYGMGRGYSSLGDYKKAIKSLEKALELAPQQANKDRVQANIDKLKKGEDIN
jgi:hypothetical protein